MSNEEELVELSEIDFLTHGEPDPEMEYILHFDKRVFDYISKKIGLVSEVEKFCDSRNYFPIQEGKDLYVDTDDDLYQDIVASMINEMEARKNPNV